MKRLELQPIGRKEAVAFIEKYHRHHFAPQGYKFAIAVNNGEQIVGVATVGRPVARHYDDGWTLEVTRVCVIEGFRNACSMLYAAAWRAARAMGYKKVISYILKSEVGTSLIAAGYKEIGLAGGGTWNTKSRIRFDKHPLEQKKLFEVAGY